MLLKFGTLFLFSLLAIAFSASADQAAECNDPTKVCLTTVGGSASGPQQVDEMVNKLGAMLEDARQENPNANILVKAFGEWADRVTRAILMNARDPIEQLTPAERAKYYLQEPEYRKNLVFALIRGTSNGGLTFYALLVSELHASSFELLPTLAAIFAMAGGIQIAHDPIEAFLESGALVRRWVPGLRVQPTDVAQLRKWNVKFSRWKYAESLAKWYLLQFAVLTVVDLTLLTTPAWDEKTLGYAFLKTLATALFSMVAQAGPTGAVYHTMDAVQNWADGRKRVEGRRDEKSDIKLSEQLKTLKRLGAMAVGVGVTIVGTLRMVDDNVWSVLVPNDTAGFAMIGAGVLGAGISEIVRRCAVSMAVAPVVADEN